MRSTLVQTVVRDTWIFSLLQITFTKKKSPLLLIYSRTHNKKQQIYTDVTNLYNA